MARCTAQWEKIGDEAISLNCFGDFDTLLNASFRKAGRKNARLRETRCWNSSQSGNGARRFDLNRKRNFLRSRAVKI